jgi:hypothetical protein
MLAIPSHITSIGDYAFFETPITSVIISSCHNIGNWTFANCLNLETIEIQTQISRLSSGIFHNCPSLNEIVIENNYILQDQILNLSSIDEIGSFAFSNSTEIKKVVFSNRNYILGGNIIESSSSLDRIEFITKPLTMIFTSNSPFEKCSNLDCVEFFSDFDCDEFGSINFKKLFKGSSLESHEGWCDSNLKCNKSSDLGIGLIVVIVIGSIVLVAIICYLIYRFVCKKNKVYNTNSSSSSSSFSSSSKSSK